MDIFAIEEGLDVEEIMSKLKEFVPHVTVMDVCNVVRRFRGIFFKSGERIEFRSNAVYEAFACCLFRMNPCLVLKHCSIEFLCDSVSSNIASVTVIDDQNAIHLSEHYHDIVAARLIHEVHDGRFRTALSHKLLLHDSVVDKVFSVVKFAELKSLFDEGKHFIYWALRSDSIALVKRVLALVRELPFENREEYYDACLMHGNQVEDYVIVSPGQDLSLIDGCLLLAVEMKSLNVTNYLLDNGASPFTVNRKKQNVFHLACANNHEEMVQTIVAHCSDDSISRVLNGTDESNLTPVMIAALNGNENIFHTLKYAKADLCLERDSDNLLHLACEGGNRAIVQYLLTTFDINSRGNESVTPLMKAADKGKVNILELLLSQNADPNLRDTRGDMAIHYACRSGSIQNVSTLVEYCDINVRGYGGLTPVMTAALAGNADIFQFLVASKADLSVSDNHNNTVVHHSSRGGNLDIVRCVISASNINSRGEHGRTPVMIAAASGHSDVLEFLISHNADLSVTDKNNTSILHIAFDKRNPDVIASIKRHVDIDHRDVHGRTPLMIAAMKGNAAAFQCLLDNNADCSLLDYRSYSVQHLACVGGNMDIVKSLWTTKKNKQGANGVTPIMMATEAGQLHVVQFLIAKGEDFRQEDANGNNLLHLACRSGNRNLVQYLLPYFNINCRGENKQTPLMIAAVYGHTHLFRLLLRERSNFKLKDSRGNTCLDLACKNNKLDITEYMISQCFAKSAEIEKHVKELAAEYGHEQIFFRVLEMGFERERKKVRFDKKLLLKACKGGNIRIVQYILRHETPALDTRDSAGKTSLLIAAERGHEDIFHLLLEEGCNLSLKDKNGNTVLHSACQWGNVDIVKYLLSTEEGKQMVDERRTQDGLTPVMVCVVAIRYKEDIFRIFADHGFDLSLTDNMDNTILHLATRFMRCDCIRYLLSKGMDTNAENKLKETPQTLKTFTHSSIEGIFQEFQDADGSG